MVPFAYQLYHWLTNGTNCTNGRASGTIVITIGTNGITNGTIGKTLNDIGIPLVPLGNPERTQSQLKQAKGAKYLGLTFITIIITLSWIANIDTIIKKAHYHCISAMKRVNVPNDRQLTPATWHVWDQFAIILIRFFT